MAREGSAYTQPRSVGRVSTVGDIRTAAPLRADDPRVGPPIQAAAVFGYVFPWVELIGDQNGENVLFSFPPPIKVLRDARGAPYCWPIWRRAQLLWTPTTPKLGEFQLVTINRLDGIVLGEAPKSDDYLIVSWVVSEFV